ncbi:MAG TPA: NADH-quinone oxidoreductase subunit J [Thermoplasmata archaeon]|nr:NADH-quinone oxidoreductase subunit J [Thermoplasmata archaeon]
MPLLGESGLSLSLEEAAFAVLGGVAVATALLALVVRELVHTIMWIAVFFVALSAIYFLLEAPFLGVLQLGVYAGAVTILLLFGVMVTRKRIFSREAATGFGPAPVGLALATVVLLAAGVASAGAGASGTLVVHPVGDLASTLFTQDGAWLLLLGLTMLGALAGAIYLVREGRE